MTYTEKLRDPRWQRMRLKIFERDGFKCASCESDSNCLNVHHKSYQKGIEPWECEPSELVTLCDKCHESVEETLRYIRRELSDPEVEQILRKALMLCSNRSSRGAIHYLLNTFVCSVDGVNEVLDRARDVQSDFYREQGHPSFILEYEI